LKLRINIWYSNIESRIYLNIKFDLAVSGKVSKNFYADYRRMFIV